MTVLYPMQSKIATPEALNDGVWWIFLTLKGDGLEWLDHDLVTPTYFQRSTDPTSRVYFIGWALSGYFGTQKSYQYLSEIKARLILTLSDYSPQILDYKPDLKNYMENAQIHLVQYELSNFSSVLNSLPSQKEVEWRSKYEAVIERERKKANTQKKNKEDLDKFSKADPLFEASRHTIYRFAYANGLEALSYEYVLMTVEVANMAIGKSQSDCIMKAKAIFAFMIEKFIIYNRQYKNWSKEQRASYMREYRKEHQIMTRTENMKRVNDEKRDATRRKILDAVTGLNFSFFLKKNGKWNAIKIAEDTGMTEKTVRAYLKQLIKEEKIQEAISL